jgi:uncharacterized protein YkwD
VAGLRCGGRRRAALIVLALLALGLAATVATRTDGPSQDGELPTGYAGLRPDWVHLKLESPAPPSTTTEVLTPPTELPTSAPTPLAPTPTEEVPLPTETIAIAGVAPPVEVSPSATAALVESPAPPTQSPAPPTPSPSPSSTPTSAGGLDLAFAEAVVELTNEARVANGLNALAQHPALVAAAQKYADLHAHVSPDRLDHNLNGSTLASRIEAEDYAGWTFLAENLLWGSFEPPLSPADAVQQWLASPAHRDNILNPTVNEIGVGCYVSAAGQPFRICVQDFGARP